jgi:iron complex transport system ATP-binding protein
MLQLNDVSFSSGTTTPLRGISLTIDEGASIALCGPAGCGKSLLLALLAGDMAPTQGTLDYLPPAGSRQKGLAAAAARPADSTLLNQNQTLFRYLCTAGSSTHDRLRPLKEEDYQAVEELLALLECGALRDQRLAELPDSLYRLVLNTATLPGNAPHILLDEPAAGLDPRSTMLLLRVLKKELSGGRRSLIFATNDLVFAARCADRIALLDRGTLAAFGPAEQVLRNSVLEPVFRNKFEISYSMLDGSPVCIPWPAG